MSWFKGNSRAAASEQWKQAIGVLPIERALADEHEALHGEDVCGEMDNVSVDFDPSQFTDIPALVRDLRKAIGASGVTMPESSAPRLRIDTELTPRDAIGRFVLQDEALQRALDAYETLAIDARPAGTAKFAAALTTRFNTLLDQRLVDESVFLPLLNSGAVAALGEIAPGMDTDARATYLRRANRALLETAFPAEIEQMRDRRLAVVFEHTRARDTAALCLSGGGIRSSTFSLGIMQGLARHGLLGKFDYLSTVSGGGLSGGWLSAWMRREGAPAVHEALRKPGREKLQPEPDPVQGLRAFSHWLTPNAGALSVDSWTVIATVIRNLLLNWLVLLPLLAGVIMLPRLLQGMLALDLDTPLHSEFLIVLGLVMGIGLMMVSAAYVEWVRTSGDDFASGRRGAPTQRQVLYWFLLPRVVGCTIVVLSRHLIQRWNDLDPAADLGAKTDLLTFKLIGVIAAGTIILAIWRRGNNSLAQALIRAGKVLICGFIGYVIPLYVVDQLPSMEWYVTLGPAILLLGSVIASQLYAGLTSDEASDAEREWSARANAWIFVVVIALITGGGLVMFGPHLLTSLWQKVTLLGVGGVSSWITVQLGKQAAVTAGTKPSTGAKLQSFALSLAGPVVVLSLVVALAAANDGTINLLCRQSALKSALHCSPPGYDSTSVPLLTLMLQTDSARAEKSLAAFKASLAVDSIPVPRTPAQFATMLQDDSVRIARSRDYTERVLALDSINGRLKRRVGTDADTIVFFLDDSVNVLPAFRKFTVLRNDSLTAEYAKYDDPSAAPSIVRAALDHALTTDTTLKGDFDRRVDSFAGQLALRDSVDNLKAESPGERALWIGVLGLLIILMLAGVFFSTVVNTNTFSLHAMWRSRTVRAFLGTTRPAAARNPNPFTDFDSDDDVPMRDLWPARVSPAEAASVGERSENVPPLHILNVTLNLAAGRDLAWQQRKGESMTLSPLHAGSAFTGYRRMEGHPKPSSHLEKPKPGYGGADGISLGTAMAISGAAASPNDGSGTSAISAFLMTFFNARLGWWLGNPGAPGAATWQLTAPKQRLTPILSEMFANTSDASAYVYLSDGGHFENLALYEMVFRRNRFIVVSDGGADPDYSFEDLGNAVRKIRIDFGIPIDFETPVNVRSGDSTAGAYWATARIKYSAIDMPAGGNPADYDGVLVYIKPAVYGALEPRDVVNYWKLSPEFPQESSADQFFSESQFESYRALGSWIIDHLVSETAAGGPPVTVNAQRKGSLLSAWPKLSGS